MRKILLNAGMCFLEMALVKNLCFDDTVPTHFLVARHKYQPFGSWELYSENSNPIPRSTTRNGQKTTSFLKK